jgi:hypothetical protein
MQFGQVTLLQLSPLLDEILKLDTLYQRVYSTQVKDPRQAKCVACELLLQKSLTPDYWAAYIMHKHSNTKTLTVLNRERE